MATAPQDGLGNTSFNWGNGRAVLGNAVFGSDGTRIYINAQTGNLVVQRQDDVLDTRGQDIAQLRTYNSQGHIGGSLNGDGDDYWRNGLTSSLSSTGSTFNPLANTIVLTDVDGTQETFTYDNANGGVRTYLRKQGEGAYDSLTFAQDGTFTWRSGSDPLGTRTYDITGRLTSARRGLGTVVRYNYAGSKLTDVTASYGLPANTAGVLSEANSTNVPGISLSQIVGVSKPSDVPATIAVMLASRC